MNRRWFGSEWDADQNWEQKKFRQTDDYDKPTADVVSGRQLQGEQGWQTMLGLLQGERTYTPPEPKDYLQVMKQNPNQYDLDDDLGDYEPSESVLSKFKKYGGDEGALKDGTLTNNNFSAFRKLSLADRSQLFASVNYPDFQREMIEDDLSQQNDLWVPTAKDIPLVDRVSEISQTVMETSAGLLAVGFQTAASILSNKLFKNIFPPGYLNENWEIRDKFLNKVATEDKGWYDFLGQARRAYQESDLPSIEIELSKLRIPQALALLSGITPFDERFPGKDDPISLPGGFSLDRIDIGIKGLLEILADPLNYVPVAGGTVRGAKLLKWAAMRLGKLAITEPQSIPGILLRGPMLPFLGAAGGAGRDVVRIAGRDVIRVSSKDVVHVAKEVAKPSVTKEVSRPTAPRGGRPPSGKPPKSTIASGLPPPNSPRGIAIKNVGSGEDPFGLRNIIPGLTKVEEYKNRVPGKLMPRMAPDEAIGTAAARESVRLVPIIDSAANSLTAMNSARLRPRFSMNKQGGIESLKGIDPELVSVVKRPTGPTGPTRRLVSGEPLAPTIADVAARFPVYQPHMTGQQIQSMRMLKMDLEPYDATLARLGVDLKARKDIMEGGFYVPRGGAELVGVDDPISLYAGGVGSGKKAFERLERFPSQAAGIADGYKYDPFEDALTSYANAAGKKSVEEHLGNYFKTISVDIGKGIEPLAIKRTARKGRVPRSSTGKINLPSLAEYSFPESVANAVNKVIQVDAPTGGPSDVLRRSGIVHNALKALSVGMQSTLDNSGPAIQGWLTFFSRPRQAAQALRSNIEALWNPNVIGELMLANDANAIGGMTTSKWNKAGLYFTGKHTEYSLRGMGLWSPEDIPVLGWGIKRANRMFAAFGDALRLVMARSFLDEELKGGYGILGKRLKTSPARTIEEIEANGDLERIASIVNRMSGWSPNRFLGGLGGFVNFAPTFFQSKLETIGVATLGLARGTVRKGTFGLASRVVRAPSMDERIATRALGKFYSTAILLTVAANAALGKDTDFEIERTLSDGSKTYNTNFMTIPWGNRDINLLGPMSLPIRLAVLAKNRRGKDITRSLISNPVVATILDLITGSDPIGRPTGDTLVQKGKTVGKRFIPIAWQESPDIVKAVSEGNPEDIASAVLAVGTSAASTPRTAMERFRDYVEKKADKPYEDVSRIDRLAYQYDDVEGKRLFGETQKDFPRTEAGKIKEEIFNLNQGRLADEAGYSDQLKFQGQRSAFNEGMRRSRTNQLHSSLTLYNQLSFINLEPKDKDSQHHALWEYRESIKDATSEGGIVDWNAAQDALDKMRPGWSKIQQEWVDDNTGQQSHETPEAKLWQETENTKRKLGFHTIHRNLPIFVENPDILKYYEQWLVAKEDKAALTDFLDQFNNPADMQTDYKKWTKDADVLRNEIVENNPQLDWGLVWTQGAAPLLISTRQKLADALPDKHKIQALINKSESGEISSLSGTEIGQLMTLDYGTLKSIAEADPWQLYNELRYDRNVSATDRLESSPSKARVRSWIIQAQKLTGVYQVTKQE
jgi:hypothetical protein